MQTMSYLAVPIDGKNKCVAGGAVPLVVKLIGTWIAFLPSDSPTLLALLLLAHVRCPADVLLGCAADGTPAVRVEAAGALNAFAIALSGKVESIKAGAVAVLVARFTAKDEKEGVLSNGMRALASIAEHPESKKVVQSRSDCGGLGRLLIPAASLPV